MERVQPVPDSAGFMSDDDHQSLAPALAWMTDRLADQKRVGEAQVLVGSALVAGSAIGPTLSGLVVDALGYRGMFWLLAGIGTMATLIVVLFVPVLAISTMILRMQRYVLKKACSRPRIIGNILVRLR